MYILKQGAFLVDFFRFSNFQYLQKMVFLDFSDNCFRSVFGVITHIFKFIQTEQIQTPNQSRQIQQKGRQNKQTK